MWKEFIFSLLGIQNSTSAVETDIFVFCIWSEWNMKMCSIDSHQLPKKYGNWWFLLNQINYKNSIFIRILVWATQEWYNCLSVLFQYVFCFHKLVFRLRPRIIFRKQNWMENFDAITMIKIGLCEHRCHNYMFRNIRYISS